MIREERFKYNPDGRSGSCYIARKYEEIFGQRVSNLPPDCVKITNGTDVEELFKTKKTLITYDYTSLFVEAKLCGMEVEYRFNPTFTGLFSFGDYWSWDDVRSSYEKQKEVYRTIQLPNFIKRTQEKFK